MTSLAVAPRDLLEVTKPRIAVLVAVTALAGMWVASAGSLDPALAGWTVLGTLLAAGSSSVLNNVADRDRDALMERTRTRALPAGRISPAGAVAWGALLGVAGVWLLAVAASPVAAVAAAAAILFYLVVYTLWLKRSSHWSTVVGGAAGAVGPLIGWAAVTGDLGLGAWALFLLVFLWQPPHFWALAIPAAEDYRRAGFPMLPVVAGEAETKRQILAYTAVLLPVSVLPALFSDSVGWVYAVVALAAGAWYVARTVRFVRAATSRRDALGLFGASVAYLFVVFAALAVDAAGA